MDNNNELTLGEITKNYAINIGSMMSVMVEDFEFLSIKKSKI